MRAWPLLVLGACNAAADPKPEPAPRGSTPAVSARASASAPPTASAAVVAPPPEERLPPPAFELVHTVDVVGTLTSLDGGVLVCSGRCDVLDPVSTVVVTGRGKPVLDDLVPPAFRAVASPIGMSQAEVSFLGAYPNGLYANVSFTMRTTDRTNTQFFAAPPVSVQVFEGGAWADSKLPFGTGAGGAPSMPHEGKVALAAAHLRNGLAGAGGPLVEWGAAPGAPLVAVTAEGRRELAGLAVPASGLRLLDGRSLIVSGGKAWVMSRGGEVAQIPGIAGAARLVVTLAGEAWIVSAEPKKTLFHAAKGLRVPGGARGPAASLGAPKKASDECKTPWVTLSTPPRAGWSYDATRAALAGKVDALQSEVTFVEYVDAGLVRFGAQCKTAAACKDLGAAFEKATRGKTAQGCLDALAAIPNPDAPPADARVVVVDLKTGAYHP